MVSQVCLARISPTAILIEDSAAAVTVDSAGAVVTFAGLVRNRDQSRAVALLEYEAHPSAATVLASIAESVAADYDGLRIAVEHRTGSLEVGDLAFSCAVSSPHRADAFAACSRLVDEVKHRVPIWKRQHFVDGTSEWLGSL
jgi:molybdopterin synthase catalytic subunit